jgi:hypothetical protein
MPCLPARGNLSVLPLVYSPQVPLRPPQASGVGPVNLASWRYNPLHY